MSGSGGIKIHTGHTHFREDLHDLVLYLLRAIAPTRQVRIPAVRTLIRHLVRITAVMTGKLTAVLMIGKRHIAMLTMRYPSTHLTLDHRCKAPAVLEEYHLLISLQGLTDARQ